MAKKTPEIYRVIDTSTRTMVEKGGFGDKMKAKKLRNKLNKEAESETRYIVSRGNDHPHGPSDGTSANQIGRRSRW